MSIVRVEIRGRRRCGCMISCGCSLLVLFKEYIFKIEG
jgi:hypothetical protein